MKLGQALDDGEPKPGAAVAGALRAAFKTVEHGLLEVLRNADAPIGDGEGDHRILRGRSMSVIVSPGAEKPMALERRL